MPLKFQKGFGLILIILIIFIAILTLGGGYYYFGVYQPKEYTKQVSRFYGDLQANRANLDSTTSVKSGNGYKDAISSLNVIDQFLSEQEAKLNKIKPPLFGPGKRFHEDFLTFFKGYHKNIDDSKRRAEFMVKAVELQEVFSPKTPPVNYAPTKIKDLQQFYNKWIPAIKQGGNDLFKDTQQPDLTEVSYDELKTSWEQAEPGFDTLWTVVRSLDPNAPFDASLEQQLQSGQVKQAGDRINTFNKLLKAAIDNNTPTDIVDLRGLVISSQQLEQKIQELQKRYFEDLGDLGGR